MIFFLDSGIEWLHTVRQYDRPDPYLLFFRFLVKVYSVVLAYPLANTTLFLLQVETAIIDISDQGNGLCKINMNSLVHGNFLIILVRVLNRAIFYADGAAGAFVFKYVPGFFDQGHVEIAGFAFDRLNFRICEHFDVWVPADLDQLG